MKNIYTDYNKEAAKLILHYLSQTTSQDFRNHFDVIMMDRSFDTMHFDVNGNFHFGFSKNGNKLSIQEFMDKIRPKQQLKNIYTEFDEELAIRTINKLESDFNHKQDFSVHNKFLGYNYSWMYFDGDGQFHFSDGISDNEDPISNVEFEKAVFAETFYSLTSESTESENQTCCKCGYESCYCCKIEICENVYPKDRRCYVQTRTNTDAEHWFNPHTCEIKASDGITFDQYQDLKKAFDSLREKYDKSTEEHSHYYDRWVNTSEELLQLKDAHNDLMAENKKLLVTNQSFENSLFISENGLYSKIVELDKENKELSNDLELARQKSENKEKYLLKYEEELTNYDIKYSELSDKLRLLERSIPKLVNSPITMEEVFTILDNLAAKEVCKILFIDCEEAIEGLMSMGSDPNNELPKSVDKINDQDKEQGLDETSSVQSGQEILNIGEESYGNNKNLKIWDSLTKTWVPKNPVATWDGPDGYELNKEMLEKSAPKTNKFFTFCKKLLVGKS